jgi:uncharacterized protein YhaN
MRIERLYIDGFGSFHDESVGGFDRSIVVLYGPNEAGKSTLLEFIRTVLFGFPARRDRYYPPFSGGRHGGRITVVDDSGAQYTVERFEGSRGGPVEVRDGSGAPLGEDRLSGIVGHATKDVFKNVFAFSLEELQTGDLLKDDNVNGQIYSAGLGATRLPDAIRTLARQRDEIFLPRGKRIVNSLISELHQVDANLAEIHGNAAEYGDRVADRDEIGVRLGSIQGELKDMASARMEMRNLEEGWDDWLSLVDVEGRLEGMPTLDTFPEDAVPRLDRAEDQLKAARQELQDASEQLESALASASATVEDEAMLEDADAIAALVRERGAFDGSVRDLPRRKTELDGMEGSLGQRVRNLGPDWDVDRLDRFELSLVVLDQIERSRSTLDDASRGLQEARSDTRLAERELTEGREDESDARTALERSEDPGLTSDQIQALRRALRTSRTTLDDHERKKDARELLKRQLEYATRQQTEGRAKAGAASLALPILSALGGAVLFAVGAFMGGQGLALGAVAGLLLVAMAAYLYTLRGAGTTGNGSAAALRQELQRAEAAVEESEANLAADAAPLGADIPDAGGLDDVEARLDAAERSLNTRGSLQEALKSATATVATRERRAEEASLAVTAAEEELVRVEDEWREWLRQRGLTDTFMPETMVDFRGQVDSAKVELRAVVAQRSRVAAIEKDILEYQGLVESLAERYQAGALSDDPGRTATVADGINARFERARSGVTLRDSGRKEADQAKARQEGRKRRVEEVDVQLKDLLAAGGTGDPEEFRRKAREHAERSRLETTRRELLTRLQRLSGPGQAAEAFRKKLHGTDIQQVREEHAQLAEREGELAEQRDALREDLGRAETLIQQLIDEKESSALRVQRAVLMEKLREHAQRWAKLTLAGELLTQARDRFQTERQPAVIQRAQKFFANVTDGRYENVFAPPGEQTVTVVERSGGHKQPDQLSRGTREQLYLALRFGLIREFGEHTESLPVIVDEVLVNFDPDRAQRAAEAFAELSQTNQVLVFTCHPSTIEAFTSAQPATQVIELPSG